MFVNLDIFHFFLFTSQTCKDRVQIQPFTRVIFIVHRMNHFTTETFLSPKYHSSLHVWSNIHAKFEQSLYLRDLGLDIEHIGVLSKVGRATSLERKTKQCDRNFSFLKEATHCKCCLLATMKNQIYTVDQNQHALKKTLQSCYVSYVNTTRV